MRPVFFTEPAQQEIEITRVRIGARPAGRLGKARAIEQFVEQPVRRGRLPAPELMFQELDQRVARAEIIVEELLAQSAHDWPKDSCAASSRRRSNGSEQSAKLRRCTIE